MIHIGPAELIRVISDTRPGLVAIDGFLGCGKTSLAKRIGRDLGYRCLALDDFLSPHRGEFLSSLDFPRLANAIGEGKLVIEGVCVLAVLERLGLVSDMLVFVIGRTPQNLSINPVLVDEVRHYLKTWSPQARAEYVVDMFQDQDSWRAQVDIAYIKAKTTLAMVLAIGGMLAIGVGLVVFVIGAKGDDSSLLKIANVEISAKGLGAVILATSSVWAYFAYLARPKYSHRREKQVSTSSDGASQVHEIESSTAITTAKES